MSPFFSHLFFFILSLRVLLSPHPCPSLIHFLHMLLILLCPSLFNPTLPYPLLLCSCHIHSPLSSPLFNPCLLSGPPPSSSFNTSLHPLPLSFLSALHPLLLLWLVLTSPLLLYPFHPLISSPKSPCLLCSFSSSALSLSSSPLREQEEDLSDRPSPPCALTRLHCVTGKGWAVPRFI